MHGRDEDAIEKLLLEVLDLPAEQRDGAIERACRERPEHAKELRARHALFKRMAAVRLRRPEDDEFGEFTLLEPLGGGGMGVVYLARQRRQDLDRLVALKLIRHGRLLSRDARERFRREARAVLRLDHPNICTIYDVGDVDDTPYIAMRYVAGETLAAKIARARSEGESVAVTTSADEATSSKTGRGRKIDDVIALIEKVARALHVAHETGLIHRDIKPGNIMVTPDGEPVVVDFGLVRDAAATDAPDLTISGEAIGTPAYMPPEQVMGRSDGIDRRADVYSLGATLYECLTLRQPFEAKTRDALYAAILQTVARPVRRVNPAISRDLDVVLATALQKELRHRYATAADFADDLRRVRELRPIRARKAGPVLRTAKWCRRNPLATAFVAVLVAALALLTAQMRSLERARRDSVKQFREARDAVESLVRTARYELADAPRLEPVRQRLFERALRFHQKFAADHGDDRDVMEDVARSLVFQGELLRDLSKLDEALLSLDQGRALLTRIHGTDPTDDRGRHALAHVHYATATVHGTDSAFEKSMPLLARATELIEAIAVDDRTTEQELLRGLILYSTAVDLHRTSRFEEALGPARRAAEVLGSVEARNPDLAPTILQGHGRALGIVGDILAELHRLDEAETAFAAAVAYLEQAPQVSRIVNALGWVLFRWARLARMRGEAEVAIGRHERAIRAYEQLVSENPETPGLRYWLASSHAALGSTLSRAQRTAEARDAFQESIAISGELCAEHAGEIRFAFTLASSRYNLALLEYRAKHWERAIELYQLTIEQLEPLLSDYPLDVRIRSLLGNCANNLSSALWRADRRQPSIEWLDRALKHKRKLLERHPDVPKYQTSYVVSLGNHARRLVSVGRREEGEALFRKCLTMRKRSADEHPEVAEYGTDVLREYQRYSANLDGDILYEAARWLGNLAPDRLAVYERLPGFVSRRREMLRIAAQRLARQARWSEARAMAKQLLGLHPDDEDARAVIARAEREGKR